WTIPTCRRSCASCGSMGRGRPERAVRCPSLLAGGARSLFLAAADDLLGPALGVPNRPAGSLPEPPAKVLRPSSRLHPLVARRLADLLLRLAGDLVHLAFAARLVR